MAVCRWLPASLAGALLVAACASPPNKEIGQAQGAIDSARAAGADKYAPDEYTAATNAFKQAGDAVEQRDYRLALNHAIESREHAQNAAREAAESRERIRGTVERSMAEVAALLAQANTRMAAAEQARVPKRALRDTQQALAQVNADVQKAGAAMQANDYMGAQPTLAGIRPRLEAIIASLEKLTTSQGPRRRK
jgi:hypothetical protein